METSLEEFTLHYHPVADLATAQVRGVEALARWQEVGPTPLFFNLSARQLEGGDLVPTLSRALEESGLPPELLRLEVTERLVMRSSARLTAVRDLGVELYVDDFGIGFSSLSYLGDLPVDGLKVDRSFTAGLGIGTSDEAIVRTILTLGETLDLDVVAEGIEREEQGRPLDDLAGRIRDTGAEIERDPLPTAYGNPEQLRQVLQNLIENVLVYCGDRPLRIEVRGEERDDGSVAVEVADRGPGIPPEAQDKVFQIFHQLDPHGSGRDGSGMGLALCREIVERHGGRIGVSSEPGEGATFRFTLDLDPEEVSRTRRRQSLATAVPPASCWWRTIRPTCG